MEKINIKAVTCNTVYLDHEEIAESVDQFNKSQQKLGIKERLEKYYRQVEDQRRTRGGKD